MPVEPRYMCVVLYDGSTSRYPGNSVSGQGQKVLVNINVVLISF